jgi:hypothetical protein
MISSTAPSATAPMTHWLILGPPTASRMIVPTAPMPYRWWASSR